jgi:hypothetical protein
MKKRKPQTTAEVGPADNPPPKSEALKRERAASARLTSLKDLFGDRALAESLKIASTNRARIDSAMREEVERDAEVKCVECAMVTEFLDMAFAGGEGIADRVGWLEQEQCRVVALLRKKEAEVAWLRERVAELEKRHRGSG